jgi:AcrR family transcriptional regulator
MTATERQTKAQTTIGRILHVAEGLFLERQYADVTMDMIVRAAEVTKGGLYHHFASKEELYLRLLHDDLTAKRDLFRAAADSRGTCRQRLTELTRSFLDLPRAKRELIRLVRRDCNTFDEPARGLLVRAYQDALPLQVEEILQGGMERGELRPSDPRLLSWCFVALVEAALGDYADSVVTALDARLEFVMTLFLDGAAWSSALNSPDGA